MPESVGWAKCGMNAADVSFLNFSFMIILSNVCRRLPAAVPGVCLTDNDPIFGEHIRLRRQPTGENVTRGRAHPDRTEEANLAFGLVDLGKVRI